MRTPARGSMDRLECRTKGADMGRPKFPWPTQGQGRAHPGKRAPCRADPPMKPLAGGTDTKILTRSDGANARKALASVPRAVRFGPGGNLPPHPVVPPDETTSPGTPGAGGNPFPLLRRVHPRMRAGAGPFTHLPAPPSLLSRKHPETGPATRKAGRDTREKCWLGDEIARLASRRDRHAKP
jgi:hypothetical protein